MKKIFLLLLLFIPPSLFCFDIAGGHRGKVTALIHNGDTVISAGEDGFIVIWSISQRAAMERFQLTTDRIKSMVKHPLKDEICVIEAGDTESPGNNRISAWNYKEKEKIFSVPGSVPFINYSAGGNYILMTHYDGSLTLRESSNGSAASSVSIPIPPGVVNFGITGKTEQNILLYQGENEDFEGQILYLDMESLSVTGRFRAPSNLSNLIIFGNNRFLAGINSNGLLVTDAASGLVLDNIPDIERSALLYAVNDGFFCFSREKNILYRFTVDRRGAIVTRQNLSIVPGNEETISAFAINGTAVFADEGGNLFMAGLTSGDQSRLFRMTHNFQERITEIAVNDNSIAFLTESGGLGFLPHDFKSLKDGDKLTLEKTRNITRITAITPFSAKGKRTDPYVLWQNANTQIPPRIIYSDLSTDELSLNFMIERQPLRSISSKNGNILVLDSAGRLCVYNFNNFPVKAAFAFSYVGAIDAAFVDDDYLILCRSAVNGNSPFLFVNYKTGETIPVKFEAQAGITAYTGNSGRVYAASVLRDQYSLRTVVSVVSVSRPINITSTLIDGEISNITIAEVNGRTAVAGGWNGAIIDTVLNFDRTHGLPVKLSACGDYFLALDSEGNISWHDKNGKLLAVFRVYKDRWAMETGMETTGGALE